MVIGVWLKVGVVEWLISIMSVDKHSADGAHTQDCVTQQDVSLLPLAAVSMSDCTSPTRSSLPGLILRISAIFFFYPRDVFTKFKTNKPKNVLAQFLLKSAVWIWMWHEKPELSIKHRSGSVFCFVEGCCHPRNCAAHKTWQRFGNTTTSVRAINAGEWASGHIVN